MAINYSDGFLTPAKLICRGFGEADAKEISFTESLGGNDSVVILGVGKDQYLIRRDEIAAAAALFPATPRRDPRR